MSQISFRGYAREDGFNPVKVPDSTRKIAQRDAAYMDGMERVNQGLIRNRESYQRGLERKFALEQRNRDQNFRWAESEQQRYNQGVLRNIEIEGEKYQRKQAVVGQQAQQALQQFSGLSKIAADTLTGIAEATAKKDQMAGMMLVYENGLSPEDWTAYQQQKEALRTGDTQINATVNQLEAEGAQQSILDQLHGLRGWKRYGAMAALAQTGGNNYPRFWSESADSMEFESPDGSGMFTLNTATNPAQRKAAEAGIRAAYLENFVGLNPALLVEHLFPKMQSFESNEFARWSSDNDKQIQQRIKEERTEDLLTEISVGGGVSAGESLLGWIERNAGGDRNSRVRFRSMAMEIIKEAVEADYPGIREAWDAIKQTEISLPGSNKKKTIAEYWRLQGVADIDSAFYAKERESYQQRQFQKTLQKEEMDQLITELFKNRVEPITQAEREALIKRYTDEGLDPPSILLNTPVAEQLEREQEEERIEMLNAMNPGLVTTEWLLGSGFSKETVNKYLSMSRGNDKLYGPESSSEISQALRVVNAELSTKLGAEIFADGSSNNPQYEWARLQAQRFFQQRYAIRSKEDSGSAIDVALQETRTAVADGFSGKGGPFARTPENPRTGDKGSFIEMGRISRNGEVVALNRKFRDNPGLLSEEVFLTDADEVRQVMRLRDRKPGAKIPDRVAMLAQSLEIDPITIINAQLKAMGEPGLLEVTSSQVLKSLSPDVQRILTYRPSLANTYQGLTMNNANTPVVEAMRPLLDLIASKESAGHNGYQAMNTGGSNNGHTPHGSANSENVFPGGLKAMTVQQVLDNQKAGRIHAAGRYQIINTNRAPTLSGLMEGRYGPTGVSLNDKFDEATQDKLAVALVRGRAGKFFDSGTGLDKAVYGMGSEWVGLQNIPAARLGQMLEQVRTALTAADSRRGPEEFRPNVVMSLSQMGRQVSSFRKETPGANFQPGIDVYFEDKQFRSPLGGVVKDISYDPGYGNYVVVEATDPRTGEKVDVLMSHIENGGVKVNVGDRVGQGQVVARQGGAGRVRSADGTIASIDFLAPAPRGSRSMAPYRDWSGLADYIRKEMGK
jgi:murein DD-endopeptidase MepM/ murein hydrolase activator NlpD